MRVARAHGQRVRCAALLALLAVGSLPSFARGDPPLPADEARDRRLVRAERPLWRQALALPNDVVLLLVWPIKQLLCWAEHVRLDARVRDVVLAPIHRRDDGDR
jgi:hypothetical protein